MEVVVEVDEARADDFIKMLDNKAVKGYRVLKPIDFVDDKEQKEIESILNNLTLDDKKIASSKTVSVEF